jgi:hypothetical protein
MNYKAIHIAACEREERKREEDKNYEEIKSANIDDLSYK